MVLGCLGAEEPPFLQGALQYTPHERSQTTERIIMTIVGETPSCIALIETGDLSFKAPAVDKPVDLVEIFADIYNYNRLTQKVAAMTDADWAKPGQLQDGRRGRHGTAVGDFLWLFFFDAIHHRGQLSTYIRPMGGKMPSIYGPSGAWSHSVSRTTPFGDAPAVRHVRCTYSVVVWLRLAAILTVASVLAAAWAWGSRLPVAPGELAEVVAPHRHAWYALPIVVSAFVVLGLVLFPVLVLIAATGLAFGPVLGPIYAMAGSVASGSAGFAIGRWLGHRRVEQLTGEPIARLAGTLQRNGTLAVFLIRKVPAPFTLVNVVVGASAISYRDFVVGTVLGMAAAVVAIAGFGSQLSHLFDDPSPGTFTRAALFVAIPLTLALVINRRLKRARPPV